MNEMDELLEKYDTETVMLKIRNHIRSSVSGIWHMDTSSNGIYGKPTIYIWVYKNSRESVVKEVTKLYPNIFHVFESSLKDKDIQDKFIIKINQTEIDMPVVSVEKKSKCSVS